MNVFTKILAYNFLIVTLGLLACTPSRETLPDVKKETANAEVKQVTKPVALLIGIPEGYYSENLLSLGVGGTNVVRYRYKLLLAAEDSCASEEGYTESLPASSMFVLDLSPLEDGPVNLCVIGIDSEGHTQDFSNATTASWMQKTTGPQQAEAFNLREGEGRLFLEWQASSEANTQYVLFRSEVALDRLELRDGMEMNLGDGISGAQVIYIGSDTSYIDEAVTRGATYYYFLFVQDEMKFYSIPVSQEILGVGEPLLWVKNDETPEAKGKAILAGAQQNADGGMDQLYICRADIYQNGILSPGQLVPGPEENISAGRCYVVATNPDNNNISTRAAVQYEVLVLRRGTLEDYLEWKPIQFDPNQIQQIPARSVAGGVEDDNTLYICRGEVDGLQRPGKIADGYQRCSVSAYNGTAALLPTLDNWEVLTFKLLEPPEEI